MKSAAVHKLIASIQELLVAPKGTPHVERELYMSLHQLKGASDVILSDNDVFASVLALHEKILSYRGTGRQMASVEMSYNLCHLAWIINGHFSEYEKPAGDPAPKLEESKCWKQIQALIDRDKLFVQGPPSRSQHTTQLRADAWTRLKHLCEMVNDPEIRKLALGVSKNPRANSRERMAAVELLSRFVGEGKPDEEIVNTLDELAANPADEILLITVLQTQIDLGLEDELSAMSKLDDWRDEED